MANQRMQDLIRPERPAEDLSRRPLFARRSVVAPERRSRLYLGLSPQQAQDLRLAFSRFLELHGRSPSLAMHGCAVRPAATETGEGLALVLWSARAAADFDLFWARYRAFYAVIAT